MDSFDKLVQTLKDNGYTVKVSQHEIYRFAKVTNRNIIAGFCTEHDGNDLNASYSYVNGSISADHIDCFNKWRSCPLNLELPKTNKEMDYLIEQLEFFGSPEGFVASDNFDDSKWVCDYPETL